MASITLENISKRYRARRGAVPAVSDLSLDIEDGEFVVLLGPSGCGKTTTLRLVAGLEQLSAGTVRIGDCVVNEMAPQERDVAMVFQDHALYPHMSVYRNMAFGLQMRKEPRDRIKTKVREAAELLGIEQLLDRKPAALSGGERQRVALGRAIVRQPQAFLFDEPLSNLDAGLRVQLRAEMKRLHRTFQTTSLYVTHDQEEAMTLGDRVVVMKDGVIQQCDAPLEVYREPVNRFVAGFVGMPPMNFLAGRLHTGDGSMSVVVEGRRMPCAASEVDALAHHRDRNVVLGARPETLTLTPADAEPVAGALPAEVQVVEPLGERQDVYLQTAAGTDLVARVPSTQFLSPTDPVNVSFDPSRLHLFSSDEAGQRLA